GVARCCRSPRGGRQADIQSGRTFMHRLFMTLSALLIAGAASAQDLPTATASFVDKDGNASGSAELRELASGGVLVRIEVTGLPEDSWVAFHVHETGSCDHATGHNSA